LLPTCHQDDGVTPFDDTSCIDIITSMVSQAVQREGYQIDEFSLEISLPAVVAANERAIR
jgi:tRNA pseudouridine synthase 10